MEGGLAPGSGNSFVAITSINAYKKHIQSIGGLTLDDLRPNLITTLIVVVASVEKVKQSHGTDYLLPIRVTDPTVGRDISFPVSIYRPSTESMPDIRSPGDIVKLQNFKTGLLDDDCCIYNKVSSYYEVYHVTSPVTTEPHLKCLRQWWQAEIVNLTDSPNDSPTANSIAEECDKPNYPKNSHPIQSPRKHTPAQAIVPQNSGSRFNPAYLKCIGDMSESVFGDLFLEVLHIMPLEDEPPEFGGRKQRCLVTDYSENPSLPLINDIQFDPPVTGHRVAWCTIHQIDKLNKMPTLKLRNKYWMRNIRANITNSGLSLTLSPHRQYPRTVMAIEVEDDHPDLEPLHIRRQQMLAEAKSTTASNGFIYNAVDKNDIDDDPSAFRSLIRSPQPADIQQSTQIFDFQYSTHNGSQVISPILAASIMSLSDILASQKLNVKFRVHVQITSIYPKTADESIVSVCKACRMRYNDGSSSCWGCQQPNPTYVDDCQFMVELVDESSKCMAICPNSLVASKFSGCNMQGLASGVVNAHSAAIERLKELWAWIRFHGEFEWIDLLVAPVIAPGPSANSLVRCLMIVDIAKPLPRVLT